MSYMVLDFCASSCVLSGLFGSCTWFIEQSATNVLNI